MQTDTAWRRVCLTCDCCVFIVIFACVCMSQPCLHTDDDLFIFITIMLKQG